MRIVMLGRPGAGKGTQVLHLARCHGLEVISTSEVLRRAAATPTPRGTAIREAMSSGGLVPDALVVDLVADAIDEAGGSIVLDGFPRTVAQCDALDHAFSGEPVDLAVELDISPQEAQARIRRRRTCPTCGVPVAGGRCPRCGSEGVRRADDDLDVVLQRLWVYERETRPVLDWFRRRGVLVSLDGSAPAERVTEELGNVIRCIERMSTVGAASGRER